MCSFKVQINILHRKHGRNPLRPWRITNAGNWSQSLFYPRDPATIYKILCEFANRDHHGNI